MNRRNNFIAGILFLFAVMQGCAVGPNFKSPELEMPVSYHYDLFPPDSVYEVIGMEWWRSFNDPILNRLIQQALDSNKNLEVAYSRIRQARLTAQNAKAQLYPSFSITAEGGWNWTQRTQTVTQQYSARPSVSWELDIFGKLRRQAEAAQAEYLSTEYGCASILLSLVSEVATTYFTLLQYDMSLHISEITYATRLEALRMMDSMFVYGASSGVDLEQAKTLTQTAAAAIPQYERAIAQTELSLNILLGKNPGSIERSGASLLSVRVPETIPVGLPSDILNRRPDVMQAYYELEASSAKIGVAIANRLPSFTITGNGGVLTNVAHGVAEGKPWVWGASAIITEPLLNWGSNKRAVDIAREENKQALLAYKQAVIIALGDVEKMLAAIFTYKTEITAYTKLLESAEKTRMMTRALYQNGQSNYLDVLDAERNVFSTNLEYSQIIQEQLTNYVNLYKALGGGF